MLPPIRYPDGARYLKIGHGTWFERPLATRDDAAAWLRGDGDAEVRDALSAMLERIFPGLRRVVTVADRCIYDATDGARPFVDMLPGARVGCCVGGNGFAAKSSDEIGRVAALMMISAIDGAPWSYDIPAETFRAQYDDEPCDEPPPAP